eukprot:489035_1
MSVKIDNKKRSFGEIQLNDDPKYQPPNKKHKANCNTVIPLQMEYSPNMQKMIDFMQHKPDSFILQMLDHSKEQYEIFKQNQLIKQLEQTSLTHFERTNKQNQT